MSPQYFKISASAKSDASCRLKDEESSGSKSRADHRREIRKSFWRCPATRFECNAGRTKSLSISALSCLLLVMAMSSGHSKTHEIARIGVIAIAVFLEPIKPKWKSMAGFTIAAAHPVNLSDGPWPIAESHILAAMIRDEPEFVTSTPYGMVLSGLGPPGEAREQLDLGIQPYLH